MENALDKIKKRKEDTLEFLSSDSTGALIKDHSHLDAGSSEQAYYHLGYFAAMKDVLFFLGEGETKN